MEDSSDNELSEVEHLSHSDADSAFSVFHSDIASNDSKSDGGGQGQNYSDISVSELSSVSSDSDTTDVEIDSQHTWHEQNFADVNVEPFTQ